MRRPPRPWLVTQPRSLARCAGRAPVPARLPLFVHGPAVCTNICAALRGTRSSAVVVDYNVHFGGGDGAAWRREPWEMASQTMSTSG